MKNLRAGLGFARSAGTPCTQWRSLQHRLQHLSISSPSRAGPSRAQSTLGGTATGQSDLTASVVAQATTVIHARPVPVSRSYFSRSVSFNDDYIRIRTLHRRLQHLPKAPQDLIPNTSWKRLIDYKAGCSEDVRASDYAVCIAMVRDLNKIHPKLKSAEVNEALVNFKREINSHVNKPKPIPIDRFGRALAVGRRKTSSARAWVVEGTGEVLVNGKTLADAFGRVHDRESVVWALKAAERLDKYNVWALVDGGGTTGQAEALALAVSKGLLAHEPALKPILRRAGTVTRDPRMVERKKPGHVKARKMPAWVKR